MKHNKVFIFVLCNLFICTLLIGCGDQKKTPEERLTGEWYEEGDSKPAFILYDDGTCEIAEKYGTGTWAVVNDNELKLTDFYGESETMKIVSIEDGCLIFEDNVTFWSLPKVQSDELDDNTNTDNKSIEIIDFWRDRTIEQNGSYYYPVSYSVGGNSSVEGYMAEDGEITPNIPGLEFKRTNDSSANTSELYDEKGGISYSKTYEDRHDGVYCGNDGKFLCRETRGNIDSVGVYLGLVDRTGNWLYSGPVNVLDIAPVDFGGDTQYQYLGEGMFCAHDLSKNHGNHLLVVNSENGKYIYLEDIYPNYLSFYNGTMIYQEWDGGAVGGYRGKICSLISDGTVSELNTNGDLTAANEKGFLTMDKVLSFYSRNGELLWIFDKYRLGNERPTMYGEYVFLDIVGADGKIYTGCIDTTGTLVYEPFQGREGYIVNGHFVLRRSEGKCDIVDLLTGNTMVALDLNLESFSIQSMVGNLFIIGNNAKYHFYNSEGKEISPYIN